MSRKQPPNSFTLWGKKWNVIFKDPLKVRYAHSKTERDKMQKKKLVMAGITIATPRTKRRDIYIRPDFRTDWTVFAHELLHALHFEMAAHKRRPGWDAWDGAVMHKRIDQMAEPLGQFLKENMR